MIDLHSHILPGIDDGVTTIEEAFMGRPEMRAFIEDTPQRWYKQPMPTSATVDVKR